MSVVSNKYVPITYSHVTYNGELRFDRACFNKTMADYKIANRQRPFNQHPNDAKIVRSWQSMDYDKRGNLVGRSYKSVSHKYEIDDMYRAYNEEDLARRFMTPMYPTIIELPDSDAEESDEGLIEDSIDSEDKPMLTEFDFDKEDYEEMNRPSPFDYCAFSLKPAKKTKKTKTATLEEKLALIKQVAQTDPRFVIPVARIIQLALLKAGKLIPTFRTIYKIGLEYDYLEDRLALDLMDFLEAIRTDPAKATTLANCLKNEGKAKGLSTHDNMYGYTDPDNFEFVPMADATKRASEKKLAKERTQETQKAEPQKSINDSLNRLEDKFKRVDSDIEINRRFNTPNPKPAPKPAPMFTSSSALKPAQKPGPMPAPMFTPRSVLKLPPMSSPMSTSSSVPKPAPHAVSKPTPPSTAPVTSRNPVDTNIRSKMNPAPKNVSSLGSAEDCKEKWLSMTPDDMSLPAIDEKTSLNAMNKFTVRAAKVADEFRLPLARLIQFAFLAMGEEAPYARMIYAKWGFEYLVNNVVWDLLDYLELIKTDEPKARIIARQFEILSVKYNICKYDPERGFVHAKTGEIESGRLIKEKTLEERVGEVPFVFRTAVYRIIQTFERSRRREVLSLRSLREDGFDFNAAEKELVERLNCFTKMIVTDYARAEQFVKKVEAEAKQVGFTRFDNTVGYVNLSDDPSHATKRVNDATCPAGKRTKTTEDEPSSLVPKHTSQSTSSSAPKPAPMPTQKPDQKPTSSSTLKTAPMHTPMSTSNSVPKPAPKSAPKPVQQSTPHATPKPTPPSTAPVTSRKPFYTNIRSKMNPPKNASSLGSAEDCKEKWLSMTPDDMSLPAIDKKASLAAMNEFTVRAAKVAKEFRLPLARLIQFAFVAMGEKAPPTRVIYAKWTFEYLVNDVVWDLLDYLELIKTDEPKARIIARQFEILSVKYNICEYDSERGFVNAMSGIIESGLLVKEKTLEERVGEVPFVFRTAVYRVIQIFERSRQRKVLSLRSLREDGFDFNAAEKELVKRLNGFTKMIVTDYARAEQFVKKVEAEAKQAGFPRFDDTIGYVNLSNDPSQATKRVNDATCPAAKRTKTTEDGPSSSAPKPAPKPTFRLVSNPAPQSTSSSAPKIAPEPTSSSAPKPTFKMVWKPASRPVRKPENLYYLFD